MTIPGGPFRDEVSLIGKRVTGIRDPQDSRTARRTSGGGVPGEAGTTGDKVAGTEDPGGGLEEVRGGGGPAGHQEVSMKLARPAVVMVSDIG